MALGPGFNGKVGLGQPSTSHTLPCTRFCILQHHSVEVARGNWSAQRNGEHSRGEGWHRETHAVDNTSRHVRPIDEDL